MNRQRKNWNTPLLSAQSSRRSVNHVWNMRSPRSPTPHDLPIVDLRYPGRRPAIHRWKSAMRKIPTTWNTKKGDKSADYLPPISAPARTRRSGVSMFEPVKQKGDGVMDIRKFSPLFKPTLGRKGKASGKRVGFVEPEKSNLAQSSSASFSFPFTLPSFHTHRATGGISPYRQTQKMRRWTPLQLPNEMAEQLQESRDALNRVAFLKWKDIRDVRLSAKETEKGLVDLDKREDVPRQLRISSELRQVIEEDYTSLARKLPRLHILQSGEIESLKTGRPEDVGGELDKKGRVIEWISTINSIEKTDMIPIINIDASRSQVIE